MTREARIVLTASRTALDANARSELRSLLAVPIDWPAVLALAIPHGVLPLLFENLHAMASELTPPSLLRQLGSYAERMRLRNESASAELAGILETLGNVGIDAIPFKGPVLQHTIYRGLPVREFADLDLMVRQDQAHAAAEVLQSKGYRLAERQQKGGLRALLRNGDEAEFRRDGSMTVDVHWRFSNVGFDFPLDPETLHSELEDLEIAGRPVRTYRPGITLLILCAHQANHRWRRLNWLCDVNALLASRGDAIAWPAVLKRAGELRCERILLTTLSLTETLLRARLPDPVCDRLLNDPGARALAQSLGSMLLDGHPKGRWVYVQMREGNRFTVCGRYFASKLRWYFA